MSFISDRLARIKPSPTLAVTAKATELRESGIDVIGLAAGEPDFDTPDHIKKAAISAIQAGQTKYTPVGGTTKMKKAVIDKFKRENELTYKMDEVVVGTGGKQVLYNALMASLNEGDEVIIPAPYWVSYPDMTLLAGGEPVIVECLESEDFKITPEKLEAAITPKTKWVVINSPSNPTGAAYTKNELRLLADVLLNHPHVGVICDDIYEHLVYDGFEFFTMAQVEPKLFDRILTVNGVSKAYSMTGWRIGYAGGPADLIKAMTKIQGQSTSNPCSISQAAAIEALNGDKKFIKDWLQAFDKRIGFVVDALNATEMLHCIKPKGAFYVFANCQKVIGKTTPDGHRLETDQDFVQYLLEQAGVAAVPGSAFGLAPYIRLSCATSMDQLEKACEKISQALACLT